MNLAKINRKLQQDFGGKVTASLEDNCIIMRGHVETWAQVMDACRMAATKGSRVHVVNDIICDEVKPQPMHMPQVKDTSLDGQKVDVLIIGGGVSGASIARELSKWKLDILLVEKESDLALQASGRNDGEVHPGVDLGRGTLKHHYVRKGNAMYTQVCKDLEVPFKRVGQYVPFDQGWLRPFIWLYCQWRRYHDGISDTRLVGSKDLKANEPYIGENFRYAIYNPDSGTVCPYGITIAYAENAVMNGARVSLNTAVTGMDVQDGKILSVSTNRGTIYPTVVINAAGVFSEEIARMAGDRFYSIHPRRGTDVILDTKVGCYLRSITSVTEFNMRKTHSKGGGVLHTVHDNLLLGPDAVETWEKENFTTNKESLAAVFKKQKKAIPKLSEKDIITYFTGVRAPTFEEDFVVEKGRHTHNLIHCAGIQSPGLTTAPAVALDVEQMAVELLRETRTVEKNPNFNPHRKGIPAVRNLPDEERSALIQKNPDYGVIVCRCEEISRGEILDALNSPICVPTVDGIKKRVRPGMGRCQGGFCAPLVTKIIAEYLGTEDLSQVRKSADEAVMTYGKTK